MTIDTVVHWGEDPAIWLARYPTLLLFHYYFDVELIQRVTGTVVSSEWYVCCLFY